MCVCVCVFRWKPRVSCLVVTVSPPWQFQLLIESHADILLPSKLFLYVTPSLRHPSSPCCPDQPIPRICCLANSTPQPFPRQPHHDGDQLNGSYLARCQTIVFALGDSVLNEEKSNKHCSQRTDRAVVFLRDIMTQVLCFTDALLSDLSGDSSREAKACFVKPSLAAPPRCRVSIVYLSLSNYTFLSAHFFENHRLSFVRKMTTVYICLVKTLPSSYTEIQ